MGEQSVVPTCFSQPWTVVCNHQRASDSSPWKASERYRWGHGWSCTHTDTHKHTHRSRSELNLNKHKQHHCKGHFYSLLTWIYINDWQYKRISLTFAKYKRQNYYTHTQKIQLWHIGYGIFLLINAEAFCFCLQSEYYWPITLDQALVVCVLHSRDGHFK